MAQRRSPRAAPKTKPSDRSSAPIFEFEYGVGQADGDHRNHDQHDEKHRRASGIGAQGVLGDIDRRGRVAQFRQQQRIKINRRPRRHAPGQDGHDFAGKAAQHRQQGGDQHDGKQTKVKVGRHSSPRKDPSKLRKTDEKQVPAPRPRPLIANAIHHVDSRIRPPAPILARCCGPSARDIGDGFADVADRPRRHACRFTFAFLLVLQPLGARQRGKNRAWSLP